MKGTEMVLKALADNGVNYVFGYTGGAIMPIFDEMEKQKVFEFIMSRHEQGAAFMAQGGYTQHLRKICRIYEQRMGELRRAVSRYFPKEIRMTDPRGGYLLWVELPSRVNALELYQRAQELGIAIIPGRLFSAADQYPNFIRLNAANWSPAARPAMERLGRVVSEMADG